MSLFLSAKAPKQKTFAIVSWSSSPIRLGRAVVPYAGPGYGWTSTNSSNTGGISWAVGCRGAAGMTRTWRGFTLGGFGHVLLIPCQGRFMCPFAVAGLGFR
jgi:hypothetical protein